MKKTKRVHVDERMYTIIKSLLSTIEGSNDSVSKAIFKITGASPATVGRVKATKDFAAYKELIKENHPKPLVKTTPTNAQAQLDVNTANTIETLNALLNAFTQLQIVNNNVIQTIQQQKLSLTTAHHSVQN